MMSNNLSSKKQIKASYYFFVVTFLACCLSSRSQEDTLQILTKAKAIAIALETNYDIKIAKNQESIAANNKHLLNSNYLPTLTANASANREETDTNTDFEGALRNDGTPRENIEILDAVTKRLNTSINLDYTLFDGLGRYYNFKALKEQHNLSQLQSREVIENTFLQLFSIYYEVARLKENTTALAQSLEISLDRKKRVAYQYEYGQVSKLEVLNAEVDITADKVDLLNATQQLKNTQRDLNVVLNQKLESLFEVDTVVTFIPPLKMNQFIAQAKSNNVNLQQVEVRNTITAFQVKQAKSFLLPNVNLTGTYGWNRIDNPASAFFPGNLRTDVSLALGASLRWDLFDGGRSITNLKNAKIQKETITLEIAQLKQRVYRDIENAKEDYHNALKILELQKVNLNTATQNFERTKEKFKRSQITSIEFRQAQFNLTNAITTKNSAKYTAKLAEIRLLQLSGQLLNVEF